MKMPLFYYPSTIAWVDDSQIFINSIKENKDLFNQHRIKTFLCPIECLESITQHEPFNLKQKIYSPCKDYEESDLVDHIPTDINFINMWNELNSIQAKNDISVLIVDQNMPGMSGIELCKQLSHLPFKKILLTGSITNSEVISAFNNKIIDCYIPKHSDNFINEVKTHLNILSEQYFAESSSSLLSLLEAGRALHFSDPEFMLFFSNWRDKNNIVKYYVIDKIGAMRVINNKYEEKNFIVYSDKTIAEFVSLHSFDDFNPYLEVISSKQRLPFFGERKNGWEFPIKEWKQHLYQPNLLNTKNKYYWFTVN